MILCQQISFLKVKENRNSPGHLMAKTHGNFNVTNLKDKLRNIGSERVLN